MVTALIVPARDTPADSIMLPLIYFGCDIADLAMKIWFCCKCCVPLYLVSRILYPWKVFFHAHIENSVFPPENVDVRMVNDVGNGSLLFLDVGKVNDDL